MPVVLPNQGLPDWLTWLLITSNEVVPDLVFMLWGNDLVPDQETVKADLVPSTFAGFQERWLHRATWTVPVIDTGKAVSTYGVTPLEFTLTANPQTVYGWAGYSYATLRLMLVERFEVPRPLEIGQTLKVLPRITLTTAAD